MSYYPNLDKFLPSEDDPGTPLAEDEFWYFWVETDRKTGEAIKRRIRKKIEIKQ